MPRSLMYLVCGLLLVVTSGCEMKNMMRSLARSSQREAVRGDRQSERDPVNLREKDNHGIHYDPREWYANTYDPTQIGNLITSDGERGVTRQTWAEAGADMQVDVDSTGTRMVFASTRYSINPQICIQSTTGQAVTVMTEDKMSDMMPKFSPDGKFVAWCSDRYGNWDILVQKTDAGPDSRPQQLTRTSDDDIHPSWSQDGRFLAFSRFNSMDGLWQIWVLDLRTRMVSYVTEGLFPEFRPIPESDEKGVFYTIAYQRHRKRDIPWFSIWTIAVRMAEDGTVRAVHSPREIIANDQWAAITPSWSPDGNYLVFATVRKSMLSQWQARIYKPDDIWVVRIDGTDLTQITSHPAPDWNPKWAKDKDNPYGRIYFTSERSGHANIWSVQPVIAGMIARNPELGGE